MSFSSSDDEIGPWKTQNPHLKRVPGRRKLRKEVRKEAGEGRGRKGTTGKRVYQEKLLDLMEGFKTQSCLHESTLPSPHTHLLSATPLPRLLTFSPAPISIHPNKKPSPSKPTPAFHPRPNSTLLLFSPNDHLKSPSPHKQVRRPPLHLPSMIDITSKGSTVLAGRTLGEGHPVLDALEKRLNRILSEKRHRGNRSVL